MAKIVYIAHPIRKPNPQENIQKILKICQSIHREDVIPFVPYLQTLQYLKDEELQDRNLGFAMNREFFQRRTVDEMWLYGDTLSEGMKVEIKLAITLGIPICPQTIETTQELQLYLSQ